MGFENLTEEQQQIVTNLETGKQNLEIAKGMGVGLYDAGKDLVTGIWNLVTKPGETVEGVIQSVTHPVDTFYYIKSSIVDSFVRDMVNGDAYSRGHWVTYALASVMGAKGAGSVAKTGISTTKAVVQKGATAATNMIEAPDITKYLPYAPQHQMAFPGGVPYNVVNGEGLKEQLISMARVETEGKGTTKDIKNYKKTFFDEYLELKGSVVVHHAIEQQILKKHPNLFSLEEIHALENLRGIPKEVNSDIHLSKIRKDWNRFYRNNPNPSKEDVISYMIELDKKYGENFNPPVKR